MSDSAKLDLAAAELEAAAARQRLSDTVNNLQARLDPKLLAEDARQVGLTAARASVNGARRNPGVVAGALAAAGLLLARHRIAGLFRGRKSPPPPPSKERHDDRSKG
ncbi:DUF3618 domain-containing protein [Sphingomonas sp. KR1UV-12]|uniref:DUF3618 domain-containing protein n=1 Tax=Sphingomonas aurea TaxID=3063994 RepID=A0ABT9EHG2_9SPHN|nr:DUF3618 domain-containing protein [Sphingomonas sp. KR1UV-12]MDP1026063.1 DUF3618 domain-containing protein [Sphingomonas sp. KR1UV-12]